MVTGSQVGWGWKAPLENIWSNPQLNQGYLELVAQDRVQVAFDCLQGWRFLNLPGQPVPVLGHLHREQVFPDIQREPPGFWLICAWVSQYDQMIWKLCFPEIHSCTFSIFQS